MNWVTRIVLLALVVSMAKKPAITNANVEADRQAQQGTGSEPARS